MKKIILSMALIAQSLILSAADLVVQSAGPIGTYGSIGAAVTAASDGDRVIINNASDGSAWTEDISIDKSLTLLSAVDSGRFKVIGDYTIVHAPGREVNIIGMDNRNGSILAGAAGTVSRTVINIMWLDLRGGQINVDEPYFELNLANSNLYGGDVYFTHGSIIGNNFRNHSIVLANETQSAEDTVKIVGNINVYKMVIASDSYYFFIANNVIYNSASLEKCLEINECKDGTGVNVIKNNSINSYGYGILLGSNTTGNIDIYNNVLGKSGAGVAYYGIRNEGATIYKCFHNYLYAGFYYGALTGIVNDGTNVLNNGVVVNNNGTNNYAGTINGGSPGVMDYDLDLTRNDAGCFGGSYTINNFHPFTAGSSRVFFLEMPSEIIVGESHSVKGYSYDR